MTDKPMNPFKISVGENPTEKCHELMLQVGGMTEDEAKTLADALSDWLTEESGWKARVQ